MSSPKTARHSFVLAISSPLWPQKNLPSIHIAAAAALKWDVIPVLHLMNRFLHRVPEFQTLSSESWWRFQRAACRVSAVIRRSAHYRTSLGVSGTTPLAGRTRPCRPSRNKELLALFSLFVSLSLRSDSLSSARPSSLPPLDLWIKYDTLRIRRWHCSNCQMPRWNNKFRCLFLLCWRKLCSLQS